MTQTDSTLDRQDSARGHARWWAQLGADVLTLVLWLSCALGVVGGGFGITVIAADAMQSGETWDGFGILLGSLIVAGGGFWALANLGLASWVRRATACSRDLGPATVLTAPGGISAFAAASSLAFILSIHRGNGLDDTVGVLLAVLFSVQLGSGLVVLAGSLWADGGAARTVASRR